MKVTQRDLREQLDEIVATLCAPTTGEGSLEIRDADGRSGGYKLIRRVSRGYSEIYHADTAFDMYEYLRGFQDGLEMAKVYLIPSGSELYGQ
jgi:hypothetical protein